MKRRRFLRFGGGAAALTVRPTWSHAAITAAGAAERAVGVVPGPHAEIMAVVQGVAAREGLPLRLEIRNAGRGINADVAAGRLDVACFQNAVDFDLEAARWRSALVNAGTTVTLPFGIYSTQRRSTRALRDGDSIGLPQEPSALARGLILLHNFGVIGLREGAGTRATLHDVAVNRRQLKLLPQPGERLVAMLPRLSAVVVDSAHAFGAGLQPARDAIGLEDARTPYADILAVRRADRDQPWLATLVRAYRSDDVKRAILDRFHDSVRRPW